MTIETPKPVSQEAIEQTVELQRACVESYLTVASAFKLGMSEADIASAVRGEMQLRGVEEYWYNIPIMVLIGTERFLQMADSDYAKKSPSEDIRLGEGDTIFIDIHPQARGQGRWGNFAATAIYRPQEAAALAFLQQMQDIQKEGIEKISAQTTGKFVYESFNSSMSEHAVKLVDVRGNLGHSMGTGPKSSYTRLFLDQDNQSFMGGEIYGIEPGGYRNYQGEVLVARFEDCVHTPQKSGQAKLLGRREPVKIVFNNR